MDSDAQGVNARAVAHCLRRVQSDPDAAASALLQRRDEAAQAEARERDRLAWHTGGHAPLAGFVLGVNCLLYTSPSPRDVEESRMPSSA